MGFEWLPPLRALSFGREVCGLYVMALILARSTDCSSRPRKAQLHTAVERVYLHMCSLLDAGMRVSCLTASEADSDLLYVVFGPLMP